MRHIVGDAAQQVATKVNPDDEQLAQIDKPADDNTWHDTPNMADIKSQIKSAVDKNTPFSKKDVKDAANKAQTNHDDPQAAAQAGASMLQQRADENIPDEQKDKAREKAKETNKITKEKTKTYFSKKMPQERREQTIWRLKKLVVEIQGHPDCKDIESHYNSFH